MTITASITKSYDFTESVESINRDRAENGQPPMTHEEIKDHVRESIEDDVGSWLGCDPDICINEDD